MISREGLKVDFDAPKYVLCELHMQKLQELEPRLVDDPKPIEEQVDVEVVDILMINMYTTNMEYSRVSIVCVEC